MSNMDFYIRQAQIYSVHTLIKIWLKYKRKFLRDRLQSHTYMRKNVLFYEAKCKCFVIY
jgi:hypothetical protein